MSIKCQVNFFETFSRLSSMFDLEYDYSAALARQNRTQQDVENIRGLVAVHDVIPKTITDRQVRVHRGVL